MALNLFFVIKMSPTQQASSKLVITTSFFFNFFFSSFIRDKLMGQI